MSSLAHFTNIKYSSNPDDVIYASLAEVEFINEKTLTPIPLLINQLYKIEGNKMFFHFNYYRLAPLKDVVELMNDKTPLGVNVSFYDKEGTTLYKVELNEFKFVDVLNVMD